MRPDPPQPATVASTVRWADGRTSDDANGFVTALACREVRRAGGSVPEEWLDVLGTCRRADAAYGFWPVGRTPGWAPDLPSDSDDTAVMLLELTLAGRVPRTEARRVACRTLASHRLRKVRDPGPPWLRRGMFTTWHRADDPRGIVDLTAVTNVLATLYALDLGAVPGVVESHDALVAAAAWAQGSRDRWTSVSPFYPEPDELARALDHAADWGVPDGGELATAVREACPRESPDAVCSMAYGPPTWHSPALAALRARSLYGARSARTYSWGREAGV
jgi:hypothetical protein